MKHAYFWILLLLHCCTCFVAQGIYAQQKPYSLEWSKCYGGSRNDEASIILPTPDGGFLLSGSTESINGDIDVLKRHDDFFALDSFRNGDIWIVKIASNGTIEWDHIYGGDNNEFVNSLKPTSDGGYILCGSTSSITGDFFYDTTGAFNVWLNGGLIDGFVMKLDSLGKMQWHTRVGGTDIDDLYDIIQTSDGSYIGAGFTYSTDELWGQLSWIGNSGRGDAFIVKLEPSGKKLWNKLYGGSSTDVFNSTIEKNDGGYVLCGKTESEDGDISKLHYRDSVNLIGPSEDIWIVDVSALGVINWEKCYGGSATDGNGKILIAKDGGYVVNGHTYSNDGDIGGYHPPLPGNGGTEPYDPWVFMIDTIGTIIRQKCFGGQYQDFISQLLPTKNGKYAFVGATRSAGDDLQGIPRRSIEGKSDIWVGEMSLTGELLWQKCLGSTHNDYAFSIAETNDDGLIVLGRVGDNNADVSGHHGGIEPHYTDIWVAKLKPTSSVEASSSGSHFANPYPNPSTDEMNLYIHPTQPVQTVQFFNPQGQEFFPLYKVDGNLLTTDTRTLAKGMYIIRITYQDLTVQEVRKFVKVD